MRDSFKRELAAMSPKAQKQVKDQLKKKKWEWVCPSCGKKRSGEITTKYVSFIGCCSGTQVTVEVMKPRPVKGKYITK